MARVEIGEVVSHARRSLDEAMHFHSIGDLEGAEKQYVRVLTKEYRVVDVLPLLAGVVTKRGDFETALYYWNKLLGMAPGHVTALIEKGGLLHKTGRVAEAITCFEIARGLAPDNALIRNNLAVAFADSGRKDEALVEFDHVLRLQPDNINAYHQIRKLSSAIVPFWHIAMMNDVPRNDAFEAAIGRAVALRGSEAQILDIGSGSGLLSMMAARFGATNIVTCESVPVISRAASAIIAANGYEDRIKVVNKMSTALTVGKDLEAKAEILISEILSSDLLAEDVLSTFEDARQRLLCDDAIVIPRKATAMGCLVESATLAAYTNVETASGFDVSRFNSLAPIRLPIHGTMTEWTRLSGDFEITSVDLTQHRHEAQLKRVSIPVTSSGTAVGVVQWMHVDLIDDITFSNHPDDYHDGGWLQLLHVFPKAVQVEAGSDITLMLGHDRSSLLILPVAPRRVEQPNGQLSS